MKYIILLMLSLLLSIKLYSAEPVISIPDLPPDEKLEPFEYDEEVYVPKVLEAYQWCLILETQLKLLKVTPVTKVFAPTSEELTDLEIDIIKKYHQKAIELEKEVLAAPEDNSILEIEELRKQISKLKFDNLKWKKKVFELTLETQDIDFYQRKNEEFIKEADSLRVHTDSIRYYYYDMMNKRIEKVRQYYENLYSNGTIPIISISGSGNKLDLNNTDIETDLSPGAMLTLNTHPFLKYGKYIDLWVEYINPSIRTYYQNIESDEVETNWVTHLYSFGVNANFTNLIRTYYFNLGFKAGAGFYWGESDPLNLNIGKPQWKGEMVRLELNLENQRFNLPVELYGSWTFMFPSKDMDFHNHSANIQSGETIYNISFGFRINLWNVPNP